MPGTNLTPLSAFRFPLLLIPLLMFTGCSGSTTQADAGTSSAAREEIVEELFVNAVGLLNELDRYNPNDVLPQILGRLNQWIALRKPITGWKVDPLVARLPADIRKLPALGNLAQFKFDREDGLSLQEAVW
ncbi:MAG TPA: hypothetical protein VHX68_17675, partial [Planctomycetaceae bacterium]|nr:hypothetical protein [Planctomycetaceae bacterium]